MNILGNNANKMNDVIFENRNKSYGAYAIRTSYNDSLKKSLLYLSSLLFLIFGSVVINNRINAVSQKDQPVILDDLKPEILTYTEVELKPLAPEPVQNTSAPAAAPQGGIPTQIIDNVTTNTTVNIDNPISGVGTETATGTSLTSTNESTVTAVNAIPSVTTTTTEVLVLAEEMPEYEGGMAGLMKYISHNISYPALAREIGKEGIVHVSFIVDESGNVQGSKVMRGIGYGCDEEVLRVISKMPRWKKAGKNQGHPVKVRFNVPVSFKLQ